VLQTISSLDHDVVVPVALTGKSTAIFGEGKTQKFRAAAHRTV